MDERDHDRPIEEPLEIGARLAAANADEQRAADPEPAADQVVEPDAARRDVAAGLARLQRRPVDGPERLDDLRFDERELVAPSGGRRPVTAAGGVSITLEPDPGQRRHPVVRNHRRPRVHRDMDVLHDAKDAGIERAGITGDGR